MSVETVEAPCRVALSEAQLIMLMGLVREYTTDKELYKLLAEARP